MSTKHCNKCSTDKPVEEFNKERAKKDGLQSQCKACKKALSKAYGKARRERMAERRRKRSPDHKEHVAEYRRANAEERVKKAREYRQANRPNLNESSRACSAGRAMPPWVTKDQRREMKAKYWEAARLTEETGIPHEVDHIVPLRAVDAEGNRIASGLHVPANLQVLTREANTEKSNRLPEELAA